METIDRRTFVKAATAASLTAAIGASPSTSTAPTSTPAKRRRYAIVGCGSRHQMYQNAIHGQYKDHAELVALCDKNEGRLELARQRAAKAGAKVPGFAHTDFATMITQTKPDAVIITTMCSTHDLYITNALKSGCDAITEKPMTTSAEKCQSVLDTCAASKKKCRVTFNYRYSPPRTQVKDILMSGEIGDVLSVDFHWLLNTHHGADYFRRWHRRKENSGGLMVHKATHHFDLVNWWLGATPTHVFATGKREFYTPTMAKRFGLAGAHERCLTCPEKAKCTFRLELEKNEALKELYLDQEKFDGYFRDRCVWSDEINIEDTMNVAVRYDNNVTMSYSLNAFNAWEGYVIAFNGTKGRLEHTAVENIVGVSGTNTTQGAIKEKGVTTIVIPLRGAPKQLEVWEGKGGHGGGDDVMLGDIFLANPPADKYQRNADERAGAASCLIGIAANQSIATGQQVKLADLVTGLKPADFAPMPSRTGELPMP